MKGKRQAPPGIKTRDAWEHPQDLVRILGDEWPKPAGVWNPNFVPYLQCVAWTHDLFEDGEHEEGRGVVADDLLREGVPLYICIDVAHLTIRPGESKDEYLARVVREATLAARIVKCVDRTGNLREGALVFKEPRWNRYVAESERYIIPMAEKVAPWFADQMRLAIASRPPVVVTTG